MAQRTSREATSHRTGDRNGMRQRSNAGRTVRTAGSKNAYVHDNTARQFDVRRELQEAPRAQLSHHARKNRDKANHMNLGYVLFLTAAICLTALILMNYLQLQAEVTAKVNTISKMESTLNYMQLENDENYNRIISNINLEEIRKVAIGELGMTYAREGQVITYESTGSDYMRRVTE